MVKISILRTCHICIISTIIIIKCYTCPLFDFERVPPENKGLCLVILLSLMATIFPKKWSTEFNFRYGTDTMSSITFTNCTRPYDHWAAHTDIFLQRRCSLLYVEKQWFSTVWYFWLEVRASKLQIFDQSCFRPPVQFYTGEEIESVQIDDVQQAHMEACSMTPLFAMLNTFKMLIFACFALRAIFPK